MTDGAYLFFTAPGAVTNDPALNALLRSHEEEANKRGAEFTNFGKVTTESGILSKTDKAYLSSDINPATMEVTHTWEPYYYQPIGDSPLDRKVLKEFLKTDMETENKRRREFAGESARFVAAISAGAQ